MLCWDGKCEEGIALCCKDCEKIKPAVMHAVMNIVEVTMKWIYIGNNNSLGMDVYRCSDCCCMIHTEKEQGLPAICPNCGGKSFDEDAKTKIDWIMVETAKPTKSGDYLCWTKFGAMVLPFSVKYNAFNSRDSYEEPGSDIHVVAWAPSIVSPKESL